MMRILTNLLAGLALSLLLTGCAAPNTWSTLPIPITPGELVVVDVCGSTLANLPDDAECWMMAVPEDPTDPDSRLIAVPVVRMRATGAEPKEPVFWLEGGPGSSNLGYRPPEWLRHDHDIVLVGYRGVDGPVKLACPETATILRDAIGVQAIHPETQARAVAATRDCAERLQAEGIDLSQYTIPQVIVDLELARKALAYSRINLLAVSYGTRVAQLYAYRHPDHLNRLVLVGLNPPGRFVMDPGVLDERLTYLAGLCAADMDCRSRTPDLVETFRSISHHMPTQWMGFPIDAGTVRVGMQALFFSRHTIPFAVDAYLAAAEGDPAGLALLNAAVRLLLPVDQIVLGDQLSKGGSADLKEYQKLGDPFPATATLGTPLSELLWSLSDGWPIVLIAPELRELQESDTAMLIVNGTVDFSTPPANLEATRPYYRNAQYVLLSNLGHVDDIVSSQPLAFERLVTSYFVTGQADPSGYVEAPLPFRPLIGLPTIARLLVGAGVLFAGALLVALIRVSLRTWRTRPRASGSRPN